MPVYGIDSTGNSQEVLVWSNMKAARSAGNGWMLIEKWEDLRDASVSNGTIAALWNFHNPKQPVRRFADRELGAQQVFAFFEKVAITQKELDRAEAKKAQAREETATEDDEEGNDQMAKTAAVKKGAVKAPAKKGATKAPAKKGGNAGNLVPRTSKWTGKKLYATAAAQKENPRKAGSHGHTSMEVVRNNKGITYEDYVSKGGRATDLAWNVEKGFVEVK